MIYSNKPYKGQGEEGQKAQASVEDCPTETWLGLKGLVDYLHVSRSTLYNMINDGRLPMYRIGRQLRIHRDTVDELVFSGKLGL